MYALIQLANSTIVVVLVGWLKDDSCSWPNIKDVSRLSKANQTPNPDWSLHKVEVKFVCEVLDQSGTYEAAKKKESKYQYSSDFNTTDSDDLSKSKRCSRRQNANESSDDENCILPSICDDNRYVLQNFSANAGKEGQSSRLAFPPVPENPVTRCSFTLSTISSPPEEVYQIVPLAHPVSSCEKLSQIGGCSFGNAVRRMLSKLMCNKLAMSLSWVGMKEKEPFSTLRIASVLISAVRRSPAFSHSHDNDIGTVIKDWLRHAKARCKE